jgi:HPt (histidine-containing phosphotransfer) domain-containing protein
VLPRFPSIALDVMSQVHTLFSPDGLSIPLFPQKVLRPNTFGVEEIMRRPAGRIRNRQKSEALPTRDEQPRSMQMRLGREARKTFVSEMLNSVTEMRAAIETSDRSVVRRLAHYLHGAAAFVDAPAMISMCSSLELLAVSGDLKRAEEILTALEIESAWLWVELNDGADNSNDVA